MNLTRGRHDTRQKGIGGAWSFGVSLAVSCKLGACHCFEELVDIEVAQLPVAAHVLKIVAAELVGASYVNDQMRIATKIEFASLLVH